METKYSSVVFVDRTNYENLQGASFTNEDVSKISYIDFPNVSLLTKATIINLNRELDKLLYFSNLSDDYFDSLVLLSAQERQYVKDSFKINLCCKVTPECYTDKKYYEIVVLPDNTLLVVVENGFLTFVTESKDNFLKFILDCLCYQYKFNLTNSLFKTYVSLKLNDNYFQLIKSRFN